MSPTPLTPARRALALIGGLIVAATWFYLVLVRPTDWSAVGGSAEALITLTGYVGGAALLLIAVLLAAVANIHIDELVKAL